MIKHTENGIITEEKYAEHQKVFSKDLPELMKLNEGRYIVYSDKNKGVCIGENRESALENARRKYQGHVIIRKIEQGISREEKVLGRKVIGF